MVRTSAIDYVIGGKHSSDMGGMHCLASILTERGGKWVGSWEVPGITYPTACIVPTSMAEVEAQIDEAGGRIIVKITRPKFRVEVVDPGILELEVGVRRGFHDRDSR